jgi:hypothetical protein
MTEVRPGCSPIRMVRLIRDALDRCRLNLSDRVVLTEAATGPYAVTPVIAAMAGASSVYAVAKTGRYGSRTDAIRQTEILADQGGVGGRIGFAAQATHRMLGEADIITNSGHLRPLDAEKIARMKPSAVIALMYEAWEFRSGDLDLKACRKRGIRVMAVNERHPAVDVFGFLGVMALKQLLDAGISVYKSRILLLSDNDFAPFIMKTLKQAGASVDLRSEWNGAAGAGVVYDAVLLAMRPRRRLNLTAPDIRRIGSRWPGAVLVQFYGDMDRSACREGFVGIWPPEDPKRGHMGILPSDIGPEAVIRLQTGGLKAAEAAFKTGRADRAYGRDMAGVFMS